MRVVELSDHPGEMLEDIYARQDADAERAQAQYEEALGQHRAHVARYRSNATEPVSNAAGGHG